MYKLTVYIPNSHVEIVKEALFTAGAGQIGHYSHCCWQVLGQGQFIPLEGNNAFIGDTDRLETVAEWRVEMVIANDNLRAVLQALKSVHPYETPAYDVVEVLDF